MYERRRTHSGLYYHPTPPEWNVCLSALVCLFLLKKKEERKNLIERSKLRFGHFSIIRCFYDDTLKISNTQPCFFLFPGTWTNIHSVRTARCTVTTPFIILRCATSLTLPSVMKQHTRSSLCRSTNSLTKQYRPDRAAAAVHWVRRIWTPRIASFARCESARYSS